MNLNHLRALVAVVDSGSFSAASQELGLTQPAVSMQLKSLESELGMELIQRAPEGTKPTPSGRAVYEKAKEILAGVRELETLVRDLNAGYAGSVVIGASSIPAAYLVPRLITEFTKKRPRISVSLRVSDTQKTLDRLLEGTVDVAFVGGARSDDRIVFLPFSKDEIVLIVPPGHPWEKLEKVTSDLFTSERLIVRETGSGTRAAVEEGLRELGINAGLFKDMVEVDSAEAVISSVEAGLGVSFVSGLAASHALRLGRVRTVNFMLPLERRFYLAYLASGKNDPLLRGLIEFVLQADAPCDREGDWGATPSVQK